MGFLIGEKMTLLGKHIKVQIFAMFFQKKKFLTTIAVSAGFNRIM